MANKDLHSRIEAVDKKLDEHIHDGIGVWKALASLKTDLRWVKRAMWSLVGLATTIAGFLLKYVLLRLP